MIATEHCWLWLGTLSPTGYGIVGTGRKRGDRRAIHRAVWEELYGPAGNMELHHLCTNRHCYNPTHLQRLSRRAHLMSHNSPNWGLRLSCNQGHGSEAVQHCPDGRRRCKKCKRIADKKRHSPRGDKK